MVINCAIERVNTLSGWVVVALVAVTDFLSTETRAVRALSLAYDYFTLQRMCGVM